MRGFVGYLAIAMLGCGAADDGDDGGVGGTGATGPGACAGEKVAEGYPELGATCGSHFMLRTRGGRHEVDYEDDLFASEGVRPASSGYMLGTGASESGYVLALFLPSLAVAKYTGEEGAQARSVIVETFDSTAKNGGALIRVAGVKGDVLWGDFAASTCTFDFEPTCFLLTGRFSTRIDDGAPDPNYGPPSVTKPGPTFVCIDPSDCAEVFPPCVTSTCDGECQPTFDDTRCDAGMMCGPEGCFMF